MVNLKARLKTPQRDWYDAMITHHNHMELQQVIKDAIDGAVENGVEERDRCLWKQTDHNRSGDGFMVLPRDKQEENVQCAHTRSRTCASEQQSTDTPSPSSAPYAHVRQTYVRFRLNTGVLPPPQTVGHDAPSVGVDSTYIEHGYGGTGGHTKR
ncbi:hypothetical protein LWI28_004101 [Acer negundo]|uniref:Uncharacterized protein n=1 Tax=Acer negundo TaxID=4023 RepID=A0AAD5NPI0_ACENE|nr:hypothetical protein LWI28_004101 [Acer negundo]